jgi:hypothetical protein
MGVLFPTHPPYRSDTSINFLLGEKKSPFLPLYERGRLPPRGL